MSTQQELTPERVLAEIGYRNFVAGLFNRDKGGDLSKDLTHAILGIVTEIHELGVATDGVNALEEKGDLAFYGVALIIVVEDIIGVEFSYDQLESFVDFTDDIHEFAAIGGLTPTQMIAHAQTDLLDKCKRFIGYGKQPEDYVQLTREALGLVNYAVDLCPWTHDDEQIITANVAKLLDRYKGLTFSADRAVNRDTAAERATLERHAS